MTNISSIFCPRCAEMTGQLWSILVLNIKSRIFNNILPQLRGDDRTIAINPRTTKINAHTTGFFLTQSSDEVKRCKYYNILFREVLTKLKGASCNVLDSFISKSPLFCVQEVSFLGRSTSAKLVTKMWEMRPRSRSANAKAVSWESETSPSFKNLG